MQLTPSRRLPSIVVSAAIVLGAACARMEPPPGGPPDKVPPHLVTVFPDSGAVLPKFGGAAEFRFDEVISEGGAANQGLGTGDLERLLILSPSTRVPKIRWRRERVTVAPAEGWKPNRIYRVELLPGIYDLRRNRSDTGAVITFSTGAAAPTTTLTGVVVDWTVRRPIPLALVEALLLPDSLPYRTLADSNGKFKFGPLPQGQYVVYGVADQNRDLKRNNREAYDSIKLAAAATDAGELWTFVHDTTPIRIDTVAATDSLAAVIRFSQMLDPKQPLSAAAVQLRRLPDSAAVAVGSLLTKEVDDSLHPPVTPPDTTRRDTVPVPQPPAPPPPPPTPTPGIRPELTTRPKLFDELVVRAATPWKPGDRFVIEIRGLRNVTGTAANVRGVLIVPEAKPEIPDSLKKRLPFPVPFPRKPKPKP